MSEHRIAEIDRLYQNVRSYQSTKEFGELLQFIKRFRHIAPFNAMLLHVQKPGSQFVTSAEDWWNQFGRTVKPGARPLIILQPFGPVAFVYEYNDTIGPPLPDYVVEPFQTNLVISSNQLRSLINNIKADGIGLYRHNYGTNIAGQIQWHSETEILTTADGKYDVKSHFTIAYNENLTDTEVYTTILHELGHLYCGHLCHNPKEEEWLPNRFNIGLTQEQMEFEAETVSWLVCERLGIENPSAQYLSGYLDANDQIPAVSIDTILKATNTIESLVKQYKPPRKELILKKHEAVAR